MKVFYDFEIIYIDTILPISIEHKIYLGQMRDNLIASVVYI